MSSNEDKKEKPQFEVRRIFLAEEANEIKNLQYEASEFKDHYPKHNQWLNKAITEITSGKKVAFGVYRAIMGSSSGELVGTVILKKGSYTETIGLKNLFIREEDRYKKYGKELCKVIDKYCAKRGYSSIKTEVPSNEIGTIEFLLKRGYNIITTKKSPYKNGDYLYEMHKSIFPSYGGDYFDLYKLALWFIKNVYGFLNIVEKGDGTFVFDLNVNTKLSKEIIEGIVPKGIAIVFDEGKKDDHEILNYITEKTKNYNLVFVFGRDFSQSIKSKCIESGISLFEEEFIYNSFKELFAFDLPEFKKENITGIVVPINPKYFKKINSNQPFAFFKGLTIGKYLKKGNKVLFFSEKSSKYPQSGLRGYGTISDVSFGSPEDIWEKYKDSNPLFGKKEYNVYVENKTGILGFIVENFKEIEPISELDEIVGKKINMEDSKEFYIDANMLNNFHEIKQENNSPNNIHSPQVFISSTLKDDLELERKELKRTITKDLKYGCYAFESGGSGHPARATILNYLRNSDIYVCIIGRRYGPPLEDRGISATEDEYNYAKELNKNILVYVKDVEREEREYEFLKKVRDYEEGTLTQTFTTTEELIEYFKKDAAKLRLK